MADLPINYGDSGKVARDKINDSFNELAATVEGYKPQIINGVWWIGTTNTGVKAEGDSIVMKVEDGYIWYKSESNSWTKIIAVADLKGSQGNPGADGNGIASITSTKVGKTTTVTITETGGTVDTFQIQDGADGVGGDGDVKGPDSSTNGHMAVFDGATGKVIRDGGGVPTGFAPGNAGTTGQVLKKTNSGYEWDDESGGGGSGDVVVSTDTGNELSTGVALWFGTETDYSSISTPDTNTLYIQYKSDGGGWQPGVNTLLYLPLDSTNTLNDLSGNGYNMTNNGNVSFGTYGGVDCAYFGTTAPYGLKNTSANIISGDYTFLVWINGDSSDSGTDFPRIFGGNNSWWLLWERRFELIHPVFLGTSAGVAYTSGWHLLAFTGNISTKSFTPYKDGVQLPGGTGNSTTSYTGILIGANESNNSEPVDRFCGYMSAVIWENRQRTATEISDYFNQTKSTYGIS